MAQLAGACVVLVVRNFLPAESLSPLAWACMQGVVAALVAATLRAPRWWWPIHLVFVPALLAAQSFGIHPGWYLAAFLALLLTYWRTDRSQVPLYLSNAITAGAVANLLPPGTSQVLDIGCGHGGLLRRIARQHAACTFTGIEHAPLPWLLGRLLSVGHLNVQIRYGDLWRMNLERFNVVYAFLSPVPMLRLWDKACSEMSAGSLLICNSFEVPGVKPVRVLHLEDARQTRLLIYKVPARR